MVQSKYLIALFWFPGKTQKEGLRRVEELKGELASLKETNRDEKKSQIQLEQKLVTATEELTKEKVQHFYLLSSFYLLRETVFIYYINTYMYYFFFLIK